MACYVASFACYVTLERLKLLTKACSLPIAVDESLQKLDSCAAEGRLSCRPIAKGALAECPKTAVDCSHLLCCRLPCIPVPVGHASATCGSSNTPSLQSFSVMTRAMCCTIILMMLLDAALQFGPNSIQL